MNAVDPEWHSAHRGVDVGAQAAIWDLLRDARREGLVEAADLILLNKIDLLPYLSFDRPTFQADVRLLNPRVPILDVSATTGEGLDAWIAWLEK